MNRKIYKIYTLALVILLISGAASAQDQLPLNPAPGYFGSLTVNGQPASPGTIVTAKIGGEVLRGSITTTQSGFYGDDPGLAKLWITGYPNEIGSTITFYVNGVAAQQTATLTGAGTSNRADLSFVGVPTPSPVGPGGGGGGGGGITSAEPIANIECMETREEFLKADVPVTYRFTAACLPTGTVVYELVITASINAGATSAKMEQLKDTSKLVTSPPPGIVYKNVNIWLGTSGFAVPKNIKEGIIRFRVSNNWFSGEKVNADEVTMLRWNGKWDAVETEQVNKDANFTYYEAKSSNFSPFAIISGKVPEIVPTATAPPAITPTPALPKLPGMLWLYALIIIVVIAAAAYYLSTAAKKKEKK